MAGIHEPGSGLFTGEGITGSGSAFDWPSSDRFWQGAFPDLTYVNADRSYDFYRPAFRFGTEEAAGRGERTFDELEPDLRSRWDAYEHRGSTNASWDEARPAVKAAWDRCCEGDRSAGSRGEGSRDSADSNRRAD